MTDTTTPSWNAWSTLQAATDGVYFWRMKSEVIQDMVITFSAKLATVNDIKVPPFFKWDGWKAVIPACEWACQTNPPEPHERHDYKNIEVEGMPITPCPFCGRTPTLHGMIVASGGGVIIPSEPHRYNCWWFKCCAWGKTPSFKDPRAIEAARRAAFDRIKRGEV